MNDISKDINSIYVRLFDHKVFLNGEIQFSLQEYEQKRNDIEVAHLFWLLEKVCDITATQINRIKESVDNTILPNSDLEKTIQVCNCILDSEGTFLQDSELESDKHRRNTEWGNFINNIHDVCKEIDAEFVKKEQELYKLYEDLEKKL